jgi:hypothetical protein
MRQLTSGDVTFLSAHLDELGLPWASWPQAVAGLSEVAVQLPSTWHGRLSLALPMGESASLRTSAPVNPEVQASPHEPPSIYLFSPSYFVTHLADGEEYRSRITSLGGAEALPTEFVSSRDAQAAAAGWDFVNTIWVHAQTGGGP